jgi:hypothetical protein
MNEMAVLKRIEIMVLFLWMCVCCCYGQTDLVAIRTIDPDEMQEIERRRLQRW